MEKQLIEIDNMIENSNNIPLDIKDIVKAICKGYYRESDGRISIEGIKNVCNAIFIGIDEEDKNFKGENTILGDTITDYDENCNVKQVMHYIKDSNYIKLISILTHELGHVITEYKPCLIKDNVYPLVKRTTTIYHNCSYNEENLLETTGYYGFRIADGFLESISSRIFLSKEFRSELLEKGYDLKDYVYKDERIFSSRIYDEYKACFELFDYIMDGYLFDFSCKKYDSNEQLIGDINKNRLNIIFKHLEQSNDAIWELKKFENKEYNDEFERLLNEYKNKKDISINLSYALLDLYGKTDKDLKFNELLNNYINTINKQSLLPISDFQASGDGSKHI